MLYANYWIEQYILLTLIHWIVIYLIDSVIHALNNWALMFRNINELYWQYELFDLHANYIFFTKCSGN